MAEVKMKTHQERAKRALSRISGVVRVDTLTAYVTGEAKAAEIIARETWPAELVQAASKALRFVDALYRVEELPGAKLAVDELRAALALYPEKEAPE